MTGFQSFLEENDAELHRHQKECHLPTPDEIRHACHIIQSTWTEEEKERRRRGYAGKVRREFMFTSPLPAHFDDLQPCAVE